MGCWKATDMLTNLPIFAGEPVVGFIIAKSHTGGKTCYPDECWRPITMPIYGVYDDYGGIEKMEDAEQFIEAIMKLAAQCIDIREGSHDKLLLPDNGRLNFFDGYISMKQTKDIIPIELVLMRRDIFDYAMNTPTCQQYLKNVYAAEVKKAAEKMNLANELFRENKMNVPESLDILSAMAVFNDYAVRSLSIDGMPHTALKTLYQLGYDLSKTGAMNIWLDHMRMQWMPTSGTGSQCGVDYEDQVRFYEHITETAKRLYLDNNC